MSLVDTIELLDLGDSRGGLSVVEGQKTIPFEIKRVYYIYGTDVSQSRGFHAHKELVQVAVCLAGSCNMVLDDGVNKEVVKLESPNKAVMIPPLVWHEMHDFSKDCVLLVFASNYYDESDYLRDYEDFLSFVRQV